MSCYKIALLLWTLLLLQLAAGRTVQHQRTTINANGERETKTWVSHEPDDAHSMESADDGADGYQSFTRGSATVRIKPSTRVIRIGGIDVPPERMIEQAKLMKGLEPVALRQLLNTRQPVTRTSFENGVKSTATYTLEPDGSITCKIVSDVDPKQVDEAFAALWQRKAQTQPADTQQPPEEPRPQSKVEPEQQHNVFEQRKESGFGVRPPAHSAPTVTTRNNFEYPKLPEVWDPKAWSRHDPFSPPDLPVDDNDFAFPDSFEDFEAQTPRTVSVSHSSKDSGPPVRTTFEMGPKEWTRKTVKISPQSEPFAQMQPEPQPQPSLQDFLMSQYETSTTPRAPAPAIAAAPSHAYAPAPPADKPVRTIDINELPVMGVLNGGQPVDEDFLRHYPSELLPPNGDRPIKTLQIDNIPRAPAQDVERTKVQTFSKTLTSDHVPTTADLDPSMQEILKRAGINPSEVTSAENNTITRVRVEPDGRVVKTTYRMRKMPIAPSEDASRRYAPFMRNVPPSSTLDDEWPALRARPTPATRPPLATRPPRYYSSSRNAVHFSAFAPESTTPAQPFDNDDDEPLEVPKTLNPLLIHPIDAHGKGAVTPATVSGRVGGGERTAPRRGSHSAIEEFLAQFGLSAALLEAQQGELVKTIVDEDGRTLTARFVLSARL